MRTFALMIDGATARGTLSSPVHNPASGEIVAEAPRCTSTELDAAMCAASRAQPGWAADHDLRKSVLERAATAVLAASTELADLVTAEQGKPRREARAEIERAAQYLRRFARLGDEDLASFRCASGETLEVRRRPLGVVAAITPWNLPVEAATRTMAPALAAGNTVVIKPSAHAPLAMLRLREVLHDVLPSGALHVVSGDDRLAELIARHPIPRRVDYTGGVSEGRRVATSAIWELKKVSLQLGGNDPAIVLDTSDVDGLSRQLFWAAFANCGQLATSIKRLYVPERLYHDMVEALAARANEARIGNGAEDATDIGPLTHLGQLERISGLVEDATAHGAQVAAGGNRFYGPGFFFPPTILANVSEGIAVVDEDQFGPVLPVIAYRSVDEAITGANATDLGRGASLWSDDPDHAAEVARHLEAGMVWTNCHRAPEPDEPSAALKWSSLADAEAWDSVRGYTELSIISRPGRAT